MIDTKSYSKSRSLLAGLVAASVAMFLSVSCSNGNGSAESSMKEDPAGTYGKFLSEIRNMDSLSTEELAISINRWQSLKDSVFSMRHRTLPAIPIPTCTVNATRFTILSTRSSPVWQGQHRVPIRTCSRSWKGLLPIAATRN